jgi:hypothetical protein
MPKRNSNKPFLIILGSVLVAFFLVILGSASNTPATYPTQQQKAPHQQVVRPEFTGMEVWRELNIFRTQQGLKAWALDDVLCNNIVGRFEMLQKNWSHDGMLEFIDSQVAKKIWPPEYKYGVSEMIAHGETPAEVVAKWAGSPSHYMALTEDTKIGCVYVWEGDVLLFTR